MANDYFGGPSAGNIKAQRGLVSSRLLTVIFVLILALNIPMLLGFQMLFIYGENPADSFESSPILSQQVPFEQIYTNQKPSQVYAHLVKDGANVYLWVTEKHPWFPTWRTVKTFTLGPEDKDFSARIMCDAGFVSITVTDRSEFSEFTITQTVQRFAGLEIPIVYIFILIGMLIPEIVAVVLLRKPLGR